MSEKLPAEILKIQLDDATFRGTGATIEPTYVNFIFGSNGTGKSTIAKAIQSGSGITYAPGRSGDDYHTLVFNQAFIDNNVRSYHNLDGVFTINDVNVRIQEQIDQKTSELAEARKKSVAASAEVDAKSQLRSDLLKSLQKDCWDKTEELRARFDKTQDGKKKAKQFTEEVQRHKPIDHDLEQLDRMCDAAYSDSAKRYARFSAVDDADILEHIEDGEILGTVIANAAQTEFAAFLKEIGSTEWFRQGHSDYHNNAHGRCPYCSRPLDDKFEEMVTASFDDHYEINLRRLNAFLQAYRDAANNLYKTLSQLPAEVYPAIDPNEYRDKLEVVKAVIGANVELIRSKIAEPTKAITLSDTSVALTELGKIIERYNRLIDENNAIVDAGPKKKIECRDRVFEHMAFALKDVLEAYERSDNALNKEISDQQAITDEQKTLIKRLQEELGELRSQTVETETAIKNINVMLVDAGFQGFEVRPRKERIERPDGRVEYVEQNPVINYEVVRTDTGEVAKDLSEGEKNFIAFLYFQQRVFGSSSAEGDAGQKIVVIDDPVSSMDSGALFIIGEQIRKMVEICRNNADNRNPVVRGNFIKQLFVLTHNAYFHREVTYQYEGRYEFVSFYLVKKRENRSSVELKRIHNPDCPTEWLNVNPVKNSYAALWEEYKELSGVSSSIPFLNVIRRILEYYFLQICGYEGSQLRRIILENNKDAYTHDAAGNEDYTKFDLATSMLSYIASSGYGVNDGLHYVDDVIDIDQCKETFRMIFQHMGQEQHFNMMMGIK